MFEMICQYVKQGPQESWALIFQFQVSKCWNQEPEKPRFLLGISAVTSAAIFADASVATNINN